MDSTVALKHQYQKTLRLFLLTRHTQAATACLKAIELLSPSSEQVTKVWTLYLTIGTAILRTEGDQIAAKALGLTHTTKETGCYELWRTMIEWHREVGLVDPALVSSTMAMSLQLAVPAVGKQVAEEWYAGLSEATAEHLSVVGEEDPVMKMYKETVDLYVGCILPAIHDYDSAHAFVHYNPYLSDNTRDVCAEKGLLRE
ncbi:hypothetical protein BDF14DRAFT_1750623 [Spinellus fusiger]|nr:hypothetical protein BDF14DRAFT_1750623 [Spinellus fusiger]